MRMISRRLFLAGSSLALFAPGCEWIKRNLIPESKPTGPIDQRPAESFAKYLNDQAAALDGLSYEDVSVTVRMGTLIDPDLSATIDCAKPRSFRMKASHALQSGQLDVGSNDRQFWMYVRQVPAGQPQYVYASHDDLAAGRAQLPVPFDPDWVFMALGMSGVDAAANPAVDIVQRQREYKLTYTGRTPQGLPVKKVTIFAADDQSGSAPQVRKHFVINPRTDEVVAAAEILRVKRTEVQNPRTGQSAVVALPTEVRLIFNGPNKQSLKLDLTLRRERVNPAFTAEQSNYLFSMSPQINGATPVNLANGGGWPQGTPNARGQMPGRNRK